jgi:glucose-6-phosphate 1-dehydrogenase
MSILVKAQPFESKISSFSIVWSKDLFLTFDARKDVIVGTFVAIETGEDDQWKGIPFFIGKVIYMERQATND